MADCSIIKEDVKIFRGDPTPIDLKKFDVESGLKSGKEVGSTMAEGPGIYFTTSRKNAESYGKNVLEAKIEKCTNIITDESKKLKPEKIKSILNTIDKETLEIALSNFDENPHTAKKILIDEINKNESPKEQLISIWADVFFHQNPQKFIKSVAKNGIDGIKVKKEGFDHYIIYNKNAIKPISQCSNNICHTLDPIKREMVYYRGGGEGEKIKGKTAKDIINYEQKELGNTDVVVEKGVNPAKIKSENTVWVTVDAESAKEYGEVVKQEYPNAKIIARDGQGGVLLDISTPKISNETMICHALNDILKNR